MAALIVHGKLCRHCSAGKCKDIGTPQLPIEIECPGCNGSGCDKCKQGMVRVDGCPSEYCSSVTNAVNMIDLFEKGLPPIAGGVLDQSVWFLEAARFMARESAQIEAESCPANQ